ncbi:hypothetical protein TNCT_550861, partial [Trichonephila clavata]
MRISSRCKCKTDPQLANSSVKARAMVLFPDPIGPRRKMTTRRSFRK